MKVLIAVSCLLAVASAGYVHSEYNYPSVHAQYVPVIGAHGVPLDEPAVAHARAEHAAAHAVAHARNGDGYGYAGHEVAPVAYASHYEGHYTGPQHIPVINQKGVPVDTPEVQAARAHHYAYVQAAQHGKQYAAGPVASDAGHYAGHYANHYSGPQHIPVITHEGVPEDTPAVKSARAHHAAAFAAAQLHGGDSDEHYANTGPVAHAGYYSYTGPQHIPVIGHNGVPLDVPEVAHARAAHAAAHAEASARHEDDHYAHPTVHAW